MKTSFAIALSLLTSLCMIDATCAQEQARPARQQPMSQSDQDAAAADADQAPLARPFDIKLVSAAADPDQPPLSQDQQDTLVLEPRQEGVAVLLFSLAPPVKVSADLPPILVGGAVVMVDMARPADDLRIKLPPLPFACYLQPILLVPGDVKVWIDQPIYIPPMLPGDVIDQSVVLDPADGPDAAQIKADAYQGK